MSINSQISDITERLRQRSTATRAAYLARLDRIDSKGGPRRRHLGCSNLAHGLAACGQTDKVALTGDVQADIAIVTAYNDMLSAHQPFEHFPDILRRAISRAGGVAQVAGGVPAMCDGITQGEAGMELSLFSRDVIALATAVALSHDMFDGVLLFGVCDKIVPGLVIGALSFGHLPMIWVPAGPMPSGLPNREKARVREEYAAGKADRTALLQAEAASYHAPGTCTFYGTANSNQMLMEMMGLHLPGASFVNPTDPLREALTAAAGERIVALAKPENSRFAVGRILDERAIINGVVGLLATGGSTNHTMHLVTMAHAAGVQLTWEDLDELSEIIPQLTRIYPNGSADVNQFHTAGGLQVLIGDLLDAGLLHEEVDTVAGPGLARYRQQPVLVEGKLEWRDAQASSLDETVLRSTRAPFAPTGGLKVLNGNLGQAIIKRSALAPQQWRIQAPAYVFADQDDVLAAFKRGELHRDVVIVLRFQGPQANGMPELHKLTPALGVLQGLGYKVALVTDGRMSGASAKIPAVIHVTPEAAVGGPLARVRDGDMITLDAESGQFEVSVDAQDFAARPPVAAPAAKDGCGRELFAAFRGAVGNASTGASIFGDFGLNAKG